ncbi:MAG: transglutaminase-like domain-containing protein [Verrucomicrobiales bacterium]|nr:transglutaminase-like domain-containing protein [Verrucomicrobiales bacterium]
MNFPSLEKSVFRLFLIPLFAAIILPSVVGAEQRKWSDAKGVAEIRAQFVRFDQEFVVLRTERDSVLRVQEAGLSSGDRAYLESIREKKRQSHFATEAAGNAGWQIRREYSQKIRGRYELKIDYPSLKAKEWVWFAARPPRIDSQNVQSNLFPNSQSITDKSPNRRLMWRARSQPDPTSPGKGSIAFVVGGELYSRHLVKSPQSIRPYSTPSFADRKRFTQASEIYDFESKEFQAWLRKMELVRDSKKEGQIAFAQRVFLTITRNFDYLYEREMNRKVSHVCQVGKSDCGGLSNLIVSVLRSNGVPARALAGRWAESSTPGDTLNGVPYTQYHVKAEFFAEGVGWVPLDMARGVSQSSDPDRLAHFGKDNGDFVTMHTDYGLVVDTIHFGTKTIRILQGTSYWVAGSGDLDGKRREETWIVDSI